MVVKMSEVILSATGLTKKYGSVVAADVPELSIFKGEFFTIVGPSGSGKSTLLGMLTGTVEPTSGQILINDRDVTHLSPEKRPTAMVFQSLALFPHMSVGENIGFSLEVRKVPKDIRNQRVLELMDQLHLPRNFIDKQISQCSGGEKQRVAIARVLAHDPEILFFDEPLSAIDYRLRKTLEVELMEIHRATGKTFVYVTHSLEEAMTMSDRLTIMRDGRVVQTGTAQTIYASPANEFVAQFLGEVNVFAVRVVANSGGTLKLESTETGDKFKVRTTDNFCTATSARLVVRPENMSILSKGEKADNVIEVEITHRLMLGSRVQYHGVHNGRKFLIEQLSKVGSNSIATEVTPGAKVRVGWSADGGILVEH